MTSFWIKNKIKRCLVKKYQNFQSRYVNILASINSFSRFCKEYYDDRSPDNIFNELKTLKKEEQPQAINNILQNWID